MKKTIVSILTTVLLVLAIPAVLVLAAPGGFTLFVADPTGEPTIEPTIEPTVEPTAMPTDEAPGITPESTEGEELGEPPLPDPTPEVTPPALERVRTAATLGIPPGRLLHIDTLAKLLGWTREQTYAQYKDASVKDLLKLTNQLRHSGKGSHPVVTPLPSPEPTAEPLPEAPTP